MERIQFLLTFILGALSMAQAQARSDEREAHLAGTWHSQADTTTTVTTLYPQGRFKTAFMDGDSEIGSVAGSWRLHGDSFVWIYDGSGREDRNPILALSDDAFSLREANGDVSSFYRHGAVDPDSPSLLPVSLGATWLFDDVKGRLGIRVAGREKLGERACYRIDWLHNGRRYQSEYWQLTHDGIQVVGRQVLGRLLLFTQPYLILKRKLRPGDSWQAEIALGDRTETFHFSAGDPQRMPLSEHTTFAIPLSVEGRHLSYRRWYAQDYGLVREDLIVNGRTLTSKRRVIV